jgi:predicted amidohydrolase YtcJ
VFLPEERVATEQALHMHTSRAAEVARLGHLVGRLAPGLRADLVVLDASPLLTNGGRLPRVLATYVDGKCAYDGR